MNKPAASRTLPRRKLPRSFKELTPAKHFNPATFFRELVWKALLTPRRGELLVFDKRGLGLGARC